MKKAIFEAMISDMTGVEFEDGYRCVRIHLEDGAHFNLPADSIMLRKLPLYGEIDFVYRKESKRWTTLPTGQPQELITFIAPMINKIAPPSDERLEEIRHLIAALDKRGVRHHLKYIKPQGAQNMKEVFKVEKYEHLGFRVVVVYVIGGDSYYINEKDHADTFAVWNAIKKGDFIDVNPKTLHINKYTQK